MDAVHPGGLGGTYGGNPVAAAASLAVLHMIERDDLLARARRVGERVMDRFGSFAERFDVVGDVRGRGAMCAIELVSDRATKEPLAVETTNAIVGRCLEEGVLVLTAGTHGNVIRLLPPITIDEALLDDGLDVLEAAIEAVAG
jgi:4-aminobutyrate aminotransferase/(S)-3-amino-2-methylpropionate transaminase